MGSICLLSDGGLPSVSCVTHYSFRSFVHLHPKNFFSCAVALVAAAPHPPRANMLRSSYDAVRHPIAAVTMLLKPKDDRGAAASLTVQVVVTLSGGGPESVMLTVETQGQMTLVWPAFGGVRAGKAKFVTLPRIERVSNKPAAAGSAAQAPKILGRALRRLGRSGRVDPESLSRSPSPTEEAHEAAGRRDATMEDVHAMVMAIVDKELRNEKSDWPRRPAEAQSLLTLRDFTGAMLLHNLLLAGAQGKDPRAHKLFLEIVHKVPRLLLDVHDGKG